MLKVWFNREPSLPSGPETFFTMLWPVVDYQLTTFTMLEILRAS
jgi:hypothetical protein